MVGWILAPCNVWRTLHYFSAYGGYTTTRLKFLSCPIHFPTTYRVQPCSLRILVRRNQYICAVVEKNYACWKQRSKKEIANSFQDSSIGEINERFGQGCTKFHRSPTCWNSNFTSGVWVSKRNPLNYLIWLNQSRWIQKRRKFLILGNLKGIHWWLKTIWRLLWQLICFLKV